MPIASIVYPLHRNSQRRIYEEGASYFITTVTYDRYPYFQIPLLSELFINDLLFARDLKQFKLHGYTVMPDHVHLLITPSVKANYSEVMRSLKTNYSRDANDIMFDGKTNIQNEGDVAPRRLQIHARHVESFFPVYRRRFIDTYGPNHNIPLFKWRKSFRDHIIRGGKDFSNHLEYIFNNAMKHALVEEPKKWKWMWVETMENQ